MVPKPEITVNKEQIQIDQELRQALDKLAELKAKGKRIVDSTRIYNRR
jgi:hypothetical protein